MKVLVEMTDEQYEEYKRRQNESEYIKSKIEALSINEILELKGYECKDKYVINDPISQSSIVHIKYKKDLETIMRKYQTNTKPSEIDERHANFRVLKGDEK